MTGRLLFALLAAALAGPVWAAAPPAGEGGAEDELLALLKEESEIATRTKMNADYVPGILSILHGDDLEDLGLRTLWEALSLVPGFESTTNNFGNPLAIARGIGFDVLTSHLKLFVDSIPVNLSFTGANHAVMTMPVSQIERVEVIRGPGAALHGEFAFAGVINVVTRQDRRRLSVGGGRFSSMEAAGHYFLARPSGLRLDVGLAFLDTD